MMRWGRSAGRLQEACLVYQRVSGHTHNDSLSLELFVEGKIEDENVDRESGP